MGIKFSNNASSNITHALTADATSVSVTPGTGALFPSIVEGKDYFYATLAGNNGLEIVKVTKRVLDTMTIERAQDGTSALIFNQGDLFELRIVAADFEDTFSHVETTLEGTISQVETVLEDTVDAINSSVDNKMSSYLPLSGGTMESAILFSVPNALGRTSNDSTIVINGGTGWNKGGRFRAYGKDAIDYPGRIEITAHDGTTYSMVTLDVNGTFKKMGHDIFTSEGGTMQDNSVIYWPTKGFLRTRNSDGLIGIYNGDNPTNGAGIWLYGNDHPDRSGGVTLQVYDKTAAKYHSVKLHSNGRFIKDNTETILTSAGGTVNYLNLPLGGLLRNDNTTLKEIILTSDQDGVPGAFLSFCNTASSSAPGNARIFTRNADGSTGPVLNLQRNGNATWNGQRIFTTADSATIAGYAMPSGEKVNWTLGANGTTYTAPANGWVYFNRAASAGEQIALQNNSKGYASRSCASLGTALSVLLPVSSGDTVQVLYNATGTQNALAFIYARGTE